MLSCGIAVCKRIRAMEGDLVLAYEKHKPFPSLIRIPSHCVWLAGDNPSNSTDSRAYGPVPIDSLRGRVMFKFAFAIPPVIPITRRVPEEADNEDEEREDIFSMQAKTLLDERRKREKPSKQQPSPYFEALNRRAIIDAWHRRQITDDEAEELLELIQTKAADAYYIHHSNAKRVQKMIQTDTKDSNDNQRKETPINEIPSDAVVVEIVSTATKESELSKNSTLKSQEPEEKPLESSSEVAPEEPVVSEIVEVIREEKHVENKTTTILKLPTASGIKVTSKSLQQHVDGARASDNA